jgi:hypothetical protein
MDGELRYKGRIPFSKTERELALSKSPVGSFTYLSCHTRSGSRPTDMMRSRRLICQERQ